MLSERAKDSSSPIVGNNLATARRGRRATGAAKSVGGVLTRKARRKKINRSFVVKEPNVKKLLLVASFSLAVVNASVAADMALKAPYKAPAPVVSWTGCFIGAHIGGGWASKNYFDPLAAPPENILGSHTADGVIGGGQVGCDYQAGPWVFGIRGLADAADLRATHLAFGDFYSTRIPWFATLTARAGYTLQPNLLVYVRGGAAWVRDRETKVDLVTGLLEGTAEVTRTGWTVGAGAEYLFAPAWSVFAEYDYMDFGRRRLTYVTPDVPPAFFPLDVRQSVQTFKVGVNYRFNWAGPVVAKY
jgi:outer membrane immunogenic protein